MSTSNNVLLYFFLKIYALCFGHKEIHTICQYCFPNIGSSNQSFKICENLCQIFMITNSFYNRTHHQILKYQSLFLLGVKIISIKSLCITRHN